MSTELGVRAEALAASYLQDRGLNVVDRNWRNRWCEIDIVATSPTGVHFVEVKYRHSADYGSGFDYITADKAQRLRRAALFWMTQKRYSGDYQIDVVAVAGDLDRPQISYLTNAITD